MVFETGVSPDQANADETHDQRRWLRYRRSSDLDRYAAGLSAVFLAKSRQDKCPFDENSWIVLPEKFATDRFPAESNARATGPEIFVVANVPSEAPAEENSSTDPSLAPNGPLVT